MRSLCIAIAALLMVAGSWRLFAARTEVAVAVVSEMPLRKTVVASGRVSAAVQVHMGALVSGRVALTPVDAGALVSRGQLLLQLEDSAERAALVQAEAALEQAQLQFEEARRQFRRQEEMYRSRVISASQFDSEQNRLDLARSQVGGSRGAVDAARARLREMAILAPADGVLLRRDIELGDLVQPGVAVLGMAVSGPLQVRVDADERYLAVLALGQTAMVVADAFPGLPFAASVIEIAPVVDRQRGTVEVKLVVEDGPGFLLNDMTVSAEICVQSIDTAVSVPRALVNDSDDRPWVWVVEDGRLQRREIRTGLRNDDHVQVIDGLAAGDQMVADSDRLLRGGQRVRVGKKVL